MFRHLLKTPSKARGGVEAQSSFRDSSHWRDVSAAKDSSPEAVTRAYACMDPAEALDRLQTSMAGLTDAEAAARLEMAGPNVLTSTKPPPWWLLLLLVLPNPFNALLAFIAVISVATPGPTWSTFAVLVTMITISSAVRFWQEYRSLGAVVKLQNSVTTNVRVLRKSGPTRPASETAQQRHVIIHEKELVPGDILSLSPGDSIAADCMILESNYLRVSQSSITGESIPVRKRATTAHGEKSSETVFDLDNIVFMGTSVVSGSALALVLLTGDDAFIATITRQLGKRREPNSFQRGIRNVSYMLIGFMLVMVPIVLAISGKITGDWKNAALFSVSVAVGLVPEMLPAIVNTNLARGAYRLSKRKAIVKRLDSIQNLGAMTVLCSDKTGTLTKDEVALQNSVDCTGHDSPHVLQLAYINAKGQGIHGNNMDSAIVDFHKTASQPISIPDHKQLAVMPFTFERRRSACIVSGLAHPKTLICKGAFDEVMALCSHIRRETGEAAMDCAARQALEALASGLISKGHRILLIATKKVPDDLAAGEDELEHVESRMTLEGMLTFLDPARDDAAESVMRLLALGVAVKVLTGDSLGAAVNVCQSLNIARDVEGDDAQATTGPELAELEGTDEFDAVVARCSLLAKLTPSQKGQVIASLRKAGHCVGMLGDGINDCIALRAADVGIAVDSGARAAKDCADVILTEKGLDIMAESVRMGRVTHGNTIKYIKMVASSNFGNVFSILIASAWLPFTPMTSLQLLVQNLLYDISQIAIPWDRMDDEYVQVPRRWDSMDLLRFIVVLGPTSSTIDMCTFCLGWFYYGIQTTSDPARVELFQTHWFLEGLLTQTLIVHLLRTTKIPVVQSRAARVLVFSTVAVMLVGFCLPFIPPIQAALGMARPADSFIGFLGAELVAYSIEVQLVKMAYVRLFKTWL